MGERLSELPCMREESLVKLGARWSDRDKQGHALQALPIETH